MFRRAVVAVVAVAGCSFAPATAWAGPDDCTFGEFGVGSWPGACWKPYAADSWLNTPLPENARVDEHSAAMVAKMLSSLPDAAQVLEVGNTGTEDFFHPYAYSRASDPVYTVRCWRYDCPSIEGAQVRIPVQARPAQGTDRHLTIVDQGSGWLYDFYKMETYGEHEGEVTDWNVRRDPAGGVLWIGSGGKTHVNGDGRGVGGDGANAAKTGLLAGPVTGAELEAGAIEHMLFMVVHCTNGRHVYPAQGNARACSDVASRPPTGQVFRLEMSDAEIESLALPRWMKTIYRAMAKYGMYVGDTGNPDTRSAFGIWVESDRTYLDYNHVGAMQRFARLHRGEDGIASSSTSGKYYMDYDRIDWSRLRAIDPCVLSRNCAPAP